jgi:hypothetical protein
MFEQYKNRIESDEGYAIEFDRSRFVYEDGVRNLRINHEMLPGPKSVAIWHDSVMELNPESNLTAAESIQILENIGRALRAVGYEVTVIKA